MHITDVGPIKVFMGKLSPKNALKLTKLGQDICPTNEDLMEKREVGRKVKTKM